MLERNLRTAPTKKMKATPAISLNPRSSIEAGVESFVSFLATSNSLSPRTQSSYAADAHQLCRFLHTCIAGPTVSSVNAASLGEYVSHLQRDGLRPRTIARKLTSVRALFDYLQHLGLGDNAAVRGIRPPVDTVPALGLSPSQVRALLRLPEHSSFTGSRDRALMELIYGCGLRLEELLPLQLSQLKTTEQQLHVPGPRSRILPLGRQTLRVLTHYLKMCADMLSQRSIQRIDAGALIVSWRGRRLRPRSAQQVLERYIRRLEDGDGQQQGPGRSRRGATALRAAFAQHLLAAGADAGGVGQLMGRTRAPVPVSLDLSALQRRYDQAHPRSNPESEADQR